MYNLYSEVKGILKEIPVDFGGGCSLEKAMVIANLIKNNNLKKSLDIGVYRGRSLFPQAISHSLYTNGVVYGVDPYSNAEALQLDNQLIKDELLRFAENTNFESIYTAVNTLRVQKRLEPNCLLIRKRSDEAFIYFNDTSITFDLIHIDGNHDTTEVMNDVHHYIKLLNDGGYIILDDISWSSVKPALEYFKFELSEVCSLQDKNNDFAVFWKGNSLQSIIKTRLLIYLSIFNAKINTSKFFTAIYK